MSDWGGDELETPRGRHTTAATPALARSLAEQLVDVAVQSAVGGEISKAAQAAVKELMTPEMREAIQRRADEAAAAAITDAFEGPETTEPSPKLYYGSVDQFVREYLRNVYRRRIDGRHRCWAGRWWEHDEALIRLEALWRSWEHLRQDAATGMSVWWRDHADHHMAVLMDPDGPFATATEGAENTSRRGEPLPYVAPPEGMFPDVREEAPPSSAH